MQMAKRILSVLLALLMLCGLAAVSASALVDLGGNDNRPTCMHGSPYCPVPNTCGACYKLFQETINKLIAEREAFYNQDIFKPGLGGGRYYDWPSFAVGEPIIEDHGSVIIIIRRPWGETIYDPIVIVRDALAAQKEIGRIDVKGFAPKYLSEEALNKEFGAELKQLAEVEPKLAEEAKAAQAKATDIKVADIRVADIKAAEGLTRGVAGISPPTELLCAWCRRPGCNGCGRKLFILTREAANWEFFAKK